MRTVRLRKDTWLLKGVPRLKKQGGKKKKKVFRPPPPDSCRRKMEGKKKQNGWRNLGRWKKNNEKREGRGEGKNALGLSALLFWGGKTAIAKKGEKGHAAGQRLRKRGRKRRNAQELKKGGKAQLRGASDLYEGEKKKVKKRRGAQIRRDWKTIFFGGKGKTKRVRRNSRSLDAALGE